VWTTFFQFPISQIDPALNRVVRQWAGSGGDSIRVGHGSVWLTDYKGGTVLRLKLPL
jgi:virginiamycin B lyase